MKISCITTVFNEGELLLGSVASVLGQSHEDLEYIIVDDGSGPETRAVLETIDDPRVTVIRQANDGLSAARNKGLEQVTGDYVCFLDADDIRPSWAFKAIAETAGRDGPDVVLCRGNLSEIDGRLNPFYDSRQFDALRDRLRGEPADMDTAAGAAARSLMQLAEPQSANKAVRRDFLRANRLSFPNGHFFEDILFHTMALARARRVSVLDTPCFTYFRRHQPQITSTRGDIRFDILAVTRLTLQMFEGEAGFRDPLHRAAVVASCVKLIRWCHDFVSHHHRYAFRELATALFRTANPAYCQLPARVPAGFEEIDAARAYLAELGVPSEQPPPATGGMEKPHEVPARLGLIQRIRGLGRA